jgi:hypothetical protein
VKGKGKNERVKMENSTPAAKPKAPAKTGG